MEVAEGVKTEFRFEELSDSAKDKVRERHNAWFHGDQWYDAVYEDFVRVAAVFGFQTSADGVYFSGFWSQGDGASFRALYRSPLGSVHEALTKEGYGDAELLRLANEIDVFMAPLRLMHHNAYWDARIYTSGHYHHSGTMRIDAVSVNGEQPFTDELDNAEKTILGIAKSLADWLYGNLRDEYEYLESDEALAETFQDHKFDESGTML